MFEQSFTLTVETDAQGRFHSTQQISSPLSLDVKITAKLQTPYPFAIQASFRLTNPEAPGVEPQTFLLSSGETADLGKWRAIAGENANVATAEGFTEPAAADTAITVLFVAEPSFF
jgi:hypothetical protein